jgi:GNAT superfamily N-acetyltransferase
MAVKLAQTDAEVRSCWPVMAQLRPHLNEEEFVKRVAVQAKETYQLAFIRSGDAVVAVAGFRFMQCLSWGRFLYVDDLVTDEKARSSGLGAELLDWLCEYARAQGYDRLELDSGVQRFGAHRFYFRQRMTIKCYHFSLDLKDS